MKINAVEPSVAKDTAPLHGSRDAASGENFESSLMDVLDAGDELPRESSGDEGETREDLETQEQTGDSTSDEETSQQTQAGDQANEDETSAGGERAPLVDEVEAVGDLVPQAAPEVVAQVPSENRTANVAATNEAATAVPAVEAAADATQAPRIAVDRVEDPRVVEPRADAAQGQKVAEVPIPVEPRPGDARPAGTAPQSIADTAQLPGGPQAPVEQQQAEQRSRGEGEQRQPSWQDAAPDRSSDASGADVRATAAGQVEVDGQVVREVAQAAASASAQADPAAVTNATQVSVAPVEPVVDVSEPGAPASPARPMPPEAIPQHVEWLVARGGGSAQIELHPPELGKLSIQVNVRGADVQVVLNVQSVSAQTVVAEYRDILDNGLASKDLKLDQFEVRDWGSRDELANRENAASRDRADRDRRGNRGRGERDESIPRGIAGALMQPGSGVATMASDDGVNLRV